METEKIIKVGIVLLLIVILGLSCYNIGYQKGHKINTEAYLEYDKCVLKNLDLTKTLIECCYMTDEADNSGATQPSPINEFTILEHGK